MRPAEIGDHALIEKRLLNFNIYGRSREPQLGSSQVCWDPEKYVNSIFSKLGLTEERSVSRRVAAVLAYLHDTERPSSAD